MPHHLHREPTATEAELLRRRDELRIAQRTLAEREQILHDLRAQIVSFEGRYMRQVGILYKQLDEWEKKRAELHAANTAPEEDDTLDEPEPVDEPAQREAPIDLKLLFRELAKRIHPDFAADPADAARRTRLMAQANDAFRREDAAALQRMLNGHDPELARNLEAETARIVTLTAQVRSDIESVDAEIAAVDRSDSAELQRRALTAAREGRDLLAEIAARVKGSIGLAMRRYELDLDRIKRPPKGLALDQVLSAETRTTPEPRWDPKRHRWIR
jgi:hypothetical protein